MFTRLIRKFSLSAHNLIAAAVCATLVAAVGSGFAYATPSNVTIYDSGNAPITVKTTGATVQTVLDKHGIELGSGVLC